MATKPSKEDRRKQYEKRETRRTIRRLHDAISQNQIEKVKDQLMADIDVNFQYGGHSALQIAVTKSFEDICDMLISRGANVNHCNAEADSLLNMAASRGYDSITSLLIQHGAELNQENYYGLTPVHSAAQQGHVNITTQLVQAGCDINKANLQCQSPLISCANQGNVNVAQALIDGQSDLNWTDLERKSALIVAAEKAHEDIVKLLVDSGCALDIQDRYGSTALCVGAKAGHTQIVKKLVEAGANLNITDNKGNTAVHEAVKSQHHDIVSLLVKAGCDVDRVELDSKQAPIHSAVRIALQYFGSAVGQMGIVHMLIEANCDLNTRDKSGWSPLYQSAFGGDLDMVKLLTQHGARISGKTEAGDTLLHAAVFGNSWPILRLFMEAGCSVNSVNKNNELPLYTAIDHRADIELIKQLLSGGSDKNTSQARTFQSPLFCATQQDFKEAVDLMLDAGCDVNQPNVDGDTALWMACSKGNEDMVNALLRYPAIDVDAGMKHLPLHEAVANGYSNIVQTLIAAGCNVNQMNETCHTALYYAADTDRLSIAMILVHNGANPSRPSTNKWPQKCCRIHSDAHPHIELEPIYAAVKNDNFAMSKLLILASVKMPYHFLSTLKDIMFRTNYVHEARLSHQTLLKHATFFASVLAKPRLLQEECRGVIRGVLANRPMVKIQKLPIPSKLKEYLLLSQILKLK